MYWHQFRCLLLTTTRSDQRKECKNRYRVPQNLPIAGKPLLWNIGRCFESTHKPKPTRGFHYWSANLRDELKLQYRNTTSTSHRTASGDAPEPRTR
jgi:hypothetical protein